MELLIEFWNRIFLPQMAFKNQIESLGNIQSTVVPLSTGKILPNPAIDETVVRPHGVPIAR